MLEDRNYRLSHCIGCAAHDPGGRLGVVADLEYGSRTDRPDFLLVPRGLFRRRTLRIPVEQVMEIDLDARRVVIHGAPVGRVHWRHPAEEIEDAVEAPFGAVRESEGRPGSRM